MDTDKNVDSDGFSLGSDSDADDPPAAAVGSGADAGDSGGASRPRPPMPKLGLGGIGNSGAAAATPLTARKPPGLGLSLGGGGDAPASRSAEPSPPDAANPSGAIPRMSLSEHRPVGLNLGALRDRAREDVDEDKSELQIRREKFAHFEKHCTEIVPGVYVSGEGVAKNRATLDEHGITHVINCVGFVIPNYFEPDLVYKTMWLQDTPDEDISPAVRLLRLHRGGRRFGRRRVLVHCSQGCQVVLRGDIVPHVEGRGFLRGHVRGGEGEARYRQPEHGVHVPDASVGQRIGTEGGPRRAQALPRGAPQRARPDLPGRQTVHELRYHAARREGRVRGGDVQS